MTKYVNKIRLPLLLSISVEIFFFNNNASYSAIWVDHLGRYTQNSKINLSR